MKIRVLQINKYYSPIIGGVESHVKDIVDNLNNHVDFTVLVCNNSLTSEVKEVPTSEVNRVKIYKIASLGKFFSMPVSLTYPFWFFKLAKQADIIHFHHPFPLGELSALLFLPFLHFRGVGLLSPRRWKKQLAISYKPKAIVTWHSDIEKQKFILFFYKPFLMKFLKAVDKIIVTSPNMAKNSPFLKNFPNKIEVIPLSVNIKKFKHKNIKTIKVIQKKYISNGKPLLLAVGRLVYYKGYQYLIEAMKNVDANLLIIGDGNLEKVLKLKIKNLNLTDKIHIIPSVSNYDLINYYHACDIFILPSVAKSEAFAIVQLEAMICGKPVINTNISTGVPWVSVDNLTGLTVEPKSSQELSKAINKLVNNEQLRIQYGKNAYNRVINNFTQEKMIEKIVKIYHSLGRDPSLQ